MKFIIKADKPSDVKQSGPRTSSDTERVETFDCSGPITAQITTSSGDVTIGASETSIIEVTLSVKEAASAHLLDDAVIKFDAQKRFLEVRSRTHDSGDAIRGLKSVIRHSNWFEFGESGPDVHVALPEGSTIEVATASGDTDIIGNLARASVASASGGVRVADEVGSLEMKTASGDVTTATVRESLTCHSASGNVRCEGVGAKTKIRTASGSVRLTAEVPSEISIQTVSGNVNVTVARGLEVDVDATSISGRLMSTMPLDSADGGPATNDVVSISAKTVSGNVSIDSSN
ncbi:MAG TPA: DUF4097 family beta strand repeat-containing protein [Acidimicrobiales bacterium]